MGTGKTLSWIIALAGLWELIAPFVLRYSVAVATYNAVIVGIILIILGAWAALSNNAGTDRTLDWINAIVGLWLVLSPFILGFSALSAVAMTNAIVVGIIVIILGIWAAVQFRNPTPRTM